MVRVAVAECDVTAVFITYFFCLLNKTRYIIRIK